MTRIYPSIYKMNCFNIKTFRLYFFIFLSLMASPIVVVAGLVAHQFSKSLVPGTLGWCMISPPLRETPLKSETIAPCNNIVCPTELRLKLQDSKL